MMKVITAVLITAAIATGGCTDASVASDAATKPERRDTASSGADAAVGDTGAALTPASLLLTVEDLPAGWAVDGSLPDRGDETAWPGCPPLEQLRIEEEAKVLFLGPTGNVGVTQEVAAANQADIDRVLGALAVAADCGTIRGRQDDGIAYELTFAAMDLPDVSGVRRAVATVMSGTFDDHDVRRVAVAAELAGVLTGMHTTAFDDEEPLDVVSLLQAVAAKTS